MRDDDAPPAGEVDRTTVIPGDVLPSDAATLETVIDQRFKALLTLATDPKDLTKALEAATEWWKVKQQASEGAGWGSALGRTTRDG